MPPEPEPEPEPELPPEPPPPLQPEEQAPEATSVQKGLAAFFLLQVSRLHVSALHGAVPRPSIIMPPPLQLHTQEQLYGMPPLPPEPLLLEELRVVLSPVLVVLEVEVVVV